MQGIIRQPGDIRSVKPVGMIYGIKSVFPCFFRFLRIPQGIVIKLVIVFTLFGIDDRTGLRILMEDVLRRIHGVITDQLIRLPEIAHPVILS